MRSSVNCHSFVGRHKNARSHQILSICGMNLVHGLPRSGGPTIVELSRMYVFNAAAAYPIDVIFDFGRSPFDQDGDNSITLP